MKIILVVLLLGISSVCASAQTAADLPLVRVDRMGGPTERAFFTFSTSVCGYTIRHDGIAEAWTDDSRRKIFQIKLGGPGRLERMYFVEFGGDLILEYEVTDRRGDWGYLIRMNQRTQKPKWITPVSAVDLGPGLIVGNDLYFSAANFLAKLDVSNGALIWQQPQPDHDGTFALPKLTAETVVFQDDAENGRMIEVDKTTGLVRKNPR